mgnify:CR=1 FL=1
MSMLNLKDLKYLVTIADTGHFGKAAERCFVSQPTLSAQLKKLEQTLGVQLVERQPNNVKLTEIGREVAERSRRWAEALRWTRWLDSSIPIPGTRRRVGWDGVVGLVPGVGDAAGFAFSLAVVTRGALLGVRGWTLARLVVVALADAAIGAIPFLGAVADFAFKANERNLRAIERYAGEPAAVDVESRRIVLTVGVATLALLCALAAGAVVLVNAIIGVL